MFYRCLQQTYRPLSRPTLTTVNYIIEIFVCFTRYIKAAYTRHRYDRISQVLKSILLLWSSYFKYPNTPVPQYFEYPKCNSIASFQMEFQRIYSEFEHQFNWRFIRRAWYNYFGSNPVCVIFDRWHFVGHNYCFIQNFGIKSHYWRWHHTWNVENWWLNVSWWRFSDNRYSWRILNDAKRYLITTLRCVLL